MSNPPANNEAFIYRNTKSIALFQRLLEYCELSTLVDGATGELVPDYVQYLAYGDFQKRSLSYWGITSVQDWDNWMIYELWNLILSEQENIIPLLPNLANAGWSSSAVAIEQLYEYWFTQRYQLQLQTLPDKLVELKNSKFVVL